MIDASKSFIKDGNKNRLRAQDIHRIVDTFTRQIEIPRYSRMVPLAEISDPKNDFNLNLPRYIDSSEPEDLQDIDAHLRGGIPDRDLDALGGYWKVLPAVRALLFESAGRPGYSRLKLPVAELKAAIFGHPEFAAFNTSVTALFQKWRAANERRLRAIKPGDHPKALVGTLSEDLLETFRAARLLDTYDVYQHLIDQESEASNKVKEAQKALDAKVVSKYGKLTEAEIKVLVVDDKWLAALAAAVQSELDRVSQALTECIRQLAERYAEPLPKLTGELATLAARVDEHLKKMGTVWN